MTRATTILRNAAKAAAENKPMSADHTKYHLAPQVSDAEQGRLIRVLS